jgi:small nuclear ribonucleoprotein (snRNP)-like protein
MSGAEGSAAAAAGTRGGDLLASLLGSRVRVTLSDGRVVDGSFDCVDSSLNVIVRDRDLGWVMVPGPHVAKVERLVRTPS